MQVSSAFDQLKLFLFHSSIYQHHQQINHLTHNQPHPTKQISKINKKIEVAWSGKDGERLGELIKENCRR
jgi:hypothetical protein